MDTTEDNCSRSGASELLREIFVEPRALANAIAVCCTGLLVARVSAQAQLADWADVSDVALLKRLLSCEEWVGSVVWRIAPLEQGASGADPSRSSERDYNGKASAEFYIVRHCQVWYVISSR